MHKEWHRIRYDLETVLLLGIDALATTTPIRPFSVLDDDLKLRDFFGRCSTGSNYAARDWKNLTGGLTKWTMATNDER